MVGTDDAQREIGVPNDAKLCVNPAPTRKFLPTAPVQTEVAGFTVSLAEAQKLEI